MASEIKRDDAPLFGDLYEDIFEGRDNKRLIYRYLDIKRKRGGRIENWMEEIEKGLK